MTGPQYVSADKHAAAAEFRLGVVMLDTLFPRIVGDIGNPDTFAFPVMFERVSGQDAETVVRGDPREAQAVFLDAARRLEEQGASLVTTSCGFLTVLQRDIGDALSIPFLSSALLLCRDVQSALAPGLCPGVVTIDATALAPAHFHAIDQPTDLPIVGVAGNGALATMIFSDLPHIDEAACRADVVAAARELQTAHAEVGAIILECTNMAPYADAVASATGLPTYSLVDMCLEAQQRWRLSRQP